MSSVSPSRLLPSLQEAGAANVSGSVQDFDNYVASQLADLHERLVLRYTESLQSLEMVGPQVDCAPAIQPNGPESDDSGVLPSPLPEGLEILGKSMYATSHPQVTGNTLGRTGLQTKAQQSMRPIEFHADMIPDSPEPSLDGATKDDKSRISKCITDHDNTMKSSATSKRLISPESHFLHNCVRDHLIAAVSRRTVAGGRKNRTMLPNVSHKYEFGMGFMILLHAGFCLWEVQHCTIHGEPHELARTFQLLFCIVFSFDVVFRILQNVRTYRSIYGISWKWDLFDFFVVATMVVDYVAHSMTGNSSNISDFEVLRWIRLVRIFRLFRLIYRTPFSLQLQIIIFTIQRTGTALVAMGIITMMVMYMVGISITQGALDVCGGQDNADPLCKHFGSMSRTVFSLFKAMYGGILWGELAELLAQHDVVHATIFVVFISVMAIIVTNVITGIVLDIERDVVSHITKLEYDERSKYLASIEKVFARMDLNKSGAISFDEFELASKDKKMAVAFAALGFDINDAKDVFKRIDRRKSGEVEIDQFMIGCLRCKGEAKALDMLHLEFQVESLSRDITQVKQSIDRLSGSLAPAATFREEPSFSVTSSCHMADSRNSLIPLPLCKVEKAEDRALSLKELLSVRSEVSTLCISEHWVDMDSGTPLCPESVNLYHFNYYRISPITLPDGVLLTGLPEESYVPGQSVEQIDASGGWKVPLAEGAVLEKTERGVVVGVTRGRFVGTGMAKAGCLLVEGLDRGVPQVVTPKGGSISYKEFLSPKVAKPRWYCSHWWGEKIFNFVACCECHAKKRRLSDGAALYWVCAFANNQHDVESDISVDPASSSFRKAMRLADGVLLILDPATTAFHRIWCDFELCCTLADTQKLLDIATTVKRGESNVPRLLSDGMLPRESAHAKTIREQEFPISILASGMLVQLEDGEASVEIDKQRILACIAQGSSDGHQETALRHANAALHAYLARAAWPQAVKRGIVNNFFGCTDGTVVRLSDTLAQDEKRKWLCMDFSRFDEVTDHEVATLAAGLPPNLEHLELRFAGCPNIRDSGLEALARRLPGSLTFLLLDFMSCQELSDVGVKTLVCSLPSGLEQLHLIFAKCPKITINAVKYFSDNLPRRIASTSSSSRASRFSAMFAGTPVDRNFVSVKELQKWRSAASPWRRRADLEL